VSFIGAGRMERRLADDAAAAGRLPVHKACARRARRRYLRHLDFEARDRDRPTVEPPTSSCFLRAALYRKKEPVRH